MAPLTQMTNQLGMLLKSQSAARRIMLLMIVVGSVGAMIWLTMRAQTGGYQIIWKDMQQSDAVEALAKLRQAGIDAKLESGNTAIKVPRMKADDAAVLLSMEGIGSGVVGFELMDKSTIGQTKFQQEKNYHRMREGELARTLLTIREIQHARVHLALPEDSLFVKDERPATASVVLTLRRGMRLDDKQVNGIVHLISHGIEGLKGENVSIVDNMGNLLNQSRRDDTAQTTADQQTFKTQYEELMKARIESMLENVIGRGKVSARVQADFDFATMHQIRETYNPDDQDQIVRMQKVQQEGVQGGKAGSGIQGVPGTGSNVPGLMAGGTAQTSNTTAAAGGSRLDMTTEYVVSKRWEESQQTTPTPMRLSVAVLVDGIYDADSSGKAAPKYRERTPEDIAKLEELVKAAIGFSDKRKDLVTVQCAQYQTETPEQIKETWLNNYTVRQMIQLGVQWGVIGLIGMLLILMVLRPAIRQILVTAVPQGFDALPDGSLRPALAGVTGGGMLSSGATNQHGVAAQGGGNALPGEMGTLEDLMGDLDESEIPPELRGNQEAIRHFKLQRMAAKQAKLTQVQAQQMHEEVVETARANPQKTVSLLRQWMDEA